MRANAEFKIDLAKGFQTLANAPIVEAAIGIQARAEGPWEAPTVSQQIRTKLPDYPKVFSHSQSVQAVKFGPTKAMEITTKDSGWKGFHIQSEVKPHIAQFDRDGFVFSRLHPYETWENFTQEAMRLWRLYIELARPAEIQQISLRYINRIELPPKYKQFERYVQPAPKPPRKMGLPFYGFFHQDMLAVPGHDYAINIIRTIQPPQDPVKQGMGLILDITVTTIQPFELRQEEMDKRLADMRWLKNEVFFGSVTRKAVDSFQHVNRKDNIRSDLV